jgi:hypothetical protein
MSKGADHKGVISPVSVWRTLFVTNEWNEIQVNYFPQSTKGLGVQASKLGAYIISLAIVSKSSKF